MNLMPKKNHNDFFSVKNQNIYDYFVSLENSECAF